MELEEDEEELENEDDDEEYDEAAEDDIEAARDDDSDELMEEEMLEALLLTSASAASRARISRPMWYWRCIMFLCWSMARCCLAYAKVPRSDACVLSHRRRAVSASR
jgi:hypothetical protein